MKRSPNELLINNYNPCWVAFWRGELIWIFNNYVLDVYACAMYIVSYISKTQKGMRELLRKAVAEAKERNTNIKQQVRDIGNKFKLCCNQCARSSVLVSKRKVKIMFPKSTMGNKQVCYFPLLPKFPSKCVSLVSKCAMRLPSLASLCPLRKT